MTGKAPYAALHLPLDAGNPDLFELLKAAGKALLEHDNGTGRPLRISRRRLALMGDRLGLCLSHFKASGGKGPRVVVRVLSRDGGIARGARAIALLLEAVRSLSALSGATEIEWLSPDTRLTPDTLPEQSQRELRKRFTALDTAEERALTESIRAAMDRHAGAGSSAASAPSEPERKAPKPVNGWVTTGAMAVLSFPAALVLAVVGGIRGGDLRTAP
ncbi:hypothetical protein [Salipiger sp. PrR002]|uniref:hypothetical protein n=1 Tax=Salipiger sp. PrR002 TaxID=2706489 RepID=UPI0013B73D53|nr:hypothetical protein [Salipiger sp. PrR002]NDV99448.1 hypothetical protein [Salipiger sp. PrR002]NDW58676.1 hypothetical protein [Salipiger sp. PrR004]